MDRNYPGTGFGDLGAGAGWSYERSAKASLVYGSSRSSHPDSELLHRQAYATPHPLQGYATNHHPGSSGQGGAWGAAGRSLGLSGLFDTGLHHASPSAPDASVMNLISALESRGPQPPPSASSLLSQFRTPSWQTAMHTPAPPELFISGALPGSGSFPSSSALSAYQHPASFSSRSFPAASLSLQDTPTFSPTSNGLLSPHDPLLHIKAPSQSSLGFDRLLSSQGAAAAAYRGSQDPTGATSAQASSRHLQSHQFNLLSSQLQDQSSQLYNASVFSSAQPQPQSQSNSAQERAVPRQDSVIKHYQRPTPAQPQLSSSAAHSLQHYLSCGGAGYQQIATHHRHAGLSCSPLGDQSPSSDHKATSRTEQYRPIIQPPYSSSSSSSSSSSAGKGTKSSSSSGYSSASSASSSRTPHTPPSASSTSSSSSSSSATSGAHPSNSVPTSPPSAPQSLPKSCLSGYGSPVPPVKTPTSALTGQTPPQQQTQSYSPNQPPTSHLAQSYGGFSSPQAQDLSSGTAGKGYGSLGGRSQSYSTDIYGADSAYGSLPSSLGGAGSPSLGYGAPGHSPALLRSSGSSGSGASGGGSSSGTGGGNSGSGGGAGNSMTNERGGGGSGAGSYHLPDSSPSPSGNSGIIRPGLHSPVPTCPTQSPGGASSNKYISSVLSPTFLASPQGYPDTRGPSSQPQSYHSTSSKTKAETSMLGVGSQRSQEEVDDDDEFLIQHLLQAQASPTPQAAHHHPQQQPSQASQQTQPQPQSVPPTSDSGKGLSYDMGKTSEERYHPQSVIRTHSATSAAGVGSAGSGGSISGLDNQLEMSLKKQQQQQQQQHQQQQHHHQQQQQQQRNERSVGSSRNSGGRGSTEQVHPHLHHHDNLSSVVHYGRGDPYSQHSLAPQHSSHTQHVSSHSQIPSHTQMELQKKPQERGEIPYPRKTPEVQQQHSQSQAAASLMDSPTDQSRQPPHLLQSVLSHTTRNKLEPHQQHHKMESHRQHQQHHKMDSHQPHQQHPKMDSHPQHQQHQKMDSHQHQQHHKLDSHSQHQQHHKMDSHAQQQQHSITQQQAVMESAGGRLGTSKHQPQSQSQTTQLQLQLQSQALEVAAAHYNHGPPPHQHEQSQIKQSSVVSSLDMLERSLSQTSSTDVAVAEDRHGGAGSGGRSGGSSERHRQQQHEPIPPLKIKLPIGTLSSSDALLRTDSLSGTDPALSDGSVGSAPSLGLSPGAPCSTESTRSQDKNKQKSQMMSEGVDDEGLEERGDEKDSESKAGFVASFLDFLKSGKRPPSLDISPGMEHDNGETSPCKSGGLRPLSPAPPPPPPPPPFGDSEGNGGLALGNCPSPKRLEDELKRNLETLPSFSSDEEDSVGKNQDLQKSISSAISALYDTPQLTSSIQPQLPPPTPQPQPQPAQAPLTPTLQPPTLSPQPTMHIPHTQPQSNEPEVLQPEDTDMDENKEEENEEERSIGRDEDSDMTEEKEPQLETLGALKLDAPLPEIPPVPATPEPPSVPPSPASSSSPSHSPLPPLSLPSPLPAPEQQQENSQPPSPVAPTSPTPPPPPPAALPQPATPPSTSPPPPSSIQKESPMPSPDSPASPEELPAPKITSLHLAQKQEDAAIVGESEEDESESGGEGIFRERDEFVVRVEDIGTLKLALQMGREPPPIWRVQKALLQKFSPEIKDGQRQFCATSNYLGYFGDAKRRYQRIYVKFLENVNKKDYVRVCSRRPWRRATPALRRQSLPRMASPPATQVPLKAVEKEERVAPPVQREQREKTRTAATATTKEQREKKEVPTALPKAKEKEREHEKEKRVHPQQDKVGKRAVPAERGRAKEEKKVVERKEKAERPPKSKLAKVKAEPPPKKRKKWLKEVASSSDSDSSDEAPSENEMPVKGGVNNRAMREMFRSYVEMLVSTALDPDMIQALEDTDDELYLPPMRKIDSILSEQKRRLLRRVSMSSQHQEILHAYSQIIVDPLDSGVVRVRLSGDAYNRKTLNRVKKTLPKPQDLKLSAESYRLYSLYHSLHHYKYHTFLQCKKETNTIEQAAEDPGQEEVVQQCMANQSWLDSLFSSFIELLTLSAKA
uniref:proline-rich protein 12 n=1 Tax=Monopterus albus TaxID=43700 RepID=UPI0009B49CBA|nr:proline-rich protein 12-like [Monopterus albus]